jgi:hypothetical protein
MSRIVFPKPNPSAIVFSPSAVKESKLCDRKLAITRKFGTRSLPLARQDKRRVFIPELNKPWLETGRSLHQEAEHYYRGLIPAPSFIDQSFPPRDAAVLIEAPVLLHLGNNIWMRGILDLADDKGPVDFKSTGALGRYANASTDEQAILYSAAWASMRASGVRTVSSVAIDDITGKRTPVDIRVIDKLAIKEDVFFRFVYFTRRYPHSSHVEDFLFAPSDLHAKAYSIAMDMLDMHTLLERVGHAKEAAPYVVSCHAYGGCEYAHYCASLKDVPSIGDWSSIMTHVETGFNPPEGYSMTSTTQLYDDSFLASTKKVKVAELEAIAARRGVSLDGCKKKEDKRTRVLEGLWLACCELLAQMPEHEDATESRRFLVAKHEFLAHVKPPTDVTRESALLEGQYLDSFALDLQLSPRQQRQQDGQLLTEPDDCYRDRLYKELENKGVDSALLAKLAGTLRIVEASTSTEVVREAQLINDYEQGAPAPMASFLGETLVWLGYDRCTKCDDTGSYSVDPPGTTLFCECPTGQAKKVNRFALTDHTHLRANHETRHTDPCLVVPDTDDIPF